MPVRAVHHSTVVRAVHHRASAIKGRIKGALRPPATARFPIPLYLPCEILLLVIDELPPEAAVCLLCACKDVRTLYCDDSIYPSNTVWRSLLSRTFPLRLTGAPGPNAPPRLKMNDRLTLCEFSRDWTSYCRQLRAVSARLQSHFHPCQSLGVHALLGPGYFVLGYVNPAACSCFQGPRITGVQIAKFVRWVSSAHSWYKHLPLQVVLEWEGREVVEACGLAA